MQTKKLNKKVVTVLYGSDFWKEILNFDALARYGMISEADLSLFEYADTPEQAFEILRDGLTRLYLDPEKPIGDIKYDPALPQLPEKARAALDDLVKDRAYDLFRLSLIG